MSRQYINNQLVLICPMCEAKGKLVKATYQYNQLKIMCEFHFLDVVNTVEKICHSKIDTNKYKL